MVQMCERVERLDRSMDLVLVFLSIISAALFQYVTALPYDPSNESQMATFVFFMHFSLKLFFLPFIPIILMWLILHLVDNENLRMFLRVFVWDLSSMTVALYIVAFTVFSLPFRFDPLKYPDIVYSTIFVAVLFGFAAILHMTVIRTYERSLMMEPSAPAYNWFFVKRWLYAKVSAPLVVFILWGLILWVSLMG